MLKVDFAAGFSSGNIASNLCESATAANPVASEMINPISKWIPRFTMTSPWLPAPSRQISKGKPIASVWCVQCGSAKVRPACRAKEPRDRVHRGVHDKPASHATEKPAKLRNASFAHDRRTEFIPFTQRIDLMTSTSLLNVQVSNGMNSVLQQRNRIPFTQRIDLMTSISLLIGR